MALGICPYDVKLKFSKVYQYFVLTLLSGVVAYLILFKLFQHLLIINVQHPQYNQYFLTKLLIFDEKYGCLGTFGEKRRKLGLLRFAMAHLLSPCVSFVHSELWSKYHMYEISFLLISQHIGLFYEIFIAAFFWEMSSMITYGNRNIKLMIKCILRNQ